MSILRTPIAVGLLLLCSAAFAGRRGNFLLDGPGARELALGDALVAGAAGGAAVYYNPARLLAGDGKGEALLQWQHPQIGVQRAWALGRFQLSPIGLGVGAKVQTMPKVEGPNGPLGSSKQAGLIGMAFPFYGGSRFGFGIGVVNQNIAGLSASSIFLNLGISHSPSKEWDVGLAIDNLYFQGLVFAEGAEKERWPVRLRFGAAYHPARLGGLSIFGEVGHSRDLGLTGGVGLQFLPIQILALRAGMNGWPRAGIGVRPFGDSRLDLDFGYRFGGLTEQPVASITYRWGLPRRRKDDRDPLVAIENRHASLVTSLESVLLQEMNAGRPTLQSALRLLAVAPNHEKAWTAVEGIVGAAVRPARAGLPGDKKERLLYLEFAEAYATGQTDLARSKGEEYLRRYGQEERGRVVSFLLQFQ